MLNYKKFLSIIIGFFILISIIFVIYPTNKQKKETQIKDQALAIGEKAYKPQLQRNSEANGNKNEPYTEKQINAIAKNIGYLNLEKFHAGFDIGKQLIDTKKIVTTAQKYNNPIQIFAYYGATIWFNSNMPSEKLNGWGDYVKTFKTDWYLKDINNSPVSANGTRANGIIIGYVLDLSNPEYRAWAVSTIIDWMERAPFAGVKFDNSDILEGTIKDTRINNNKKTWNELLCGPLAPVNSNGNCIKVELWNEGLRTLLNETTQALHSIGKSVLYNGVSPAKLHGNDRNTSLFSVTDGAMNETFCYKQNVNINNQKLTLNPLIDDIKMMIDQAKIGKKIFEMTNNNNLPEKTVLANYCLAGFLMGWQPEYNYYTYHVDYDTDLSTYPENPEQNLNLGNPITEYIQSGDILSRTFQNGFVAVNIGDKNATINAPVAMNEYKNGLLITSFTSGKTISIAPKNGKFFLYQSYKIQPEK